MKNVTYTTSEVTIFVFKLTNFEILPYLLHFSEVLKRMLIIKHFVG